MWASGSPGISTGARTLRRNSALRLAVLFAALVLALTLAAAGVVAIAAAQSGGSSFNLNSPVSFPVDI